jgi:hypothetical protein
VQRITPDNLQSDKLRTAPVRRVLKKMRRILTKMAMGETMGFRLVTERIEASLHAFPEIFQTF